MIDYYETKAHPITRKMVWDAYNEIRKNGKAAGVDGVTFESYEVDLQANLYKLWNRLTSGSYFPQLTREKSIPKTGGGTRSLGIATVEDRTAQQVVRAYLEQRMEPTFHDNSFGYRPGRHAHQAIKSATDNCMTHYWMLDIDIKGYFDTIDHDLLMKAVKRYTDEKWVLMYTERWLKAGTLKEDGTVAERFEGTAQGSVLSPLLSNVFLHFVFDKWMDKCYPRFKFERYSDDIIVHCKSEQQAQFIKAEISQRFTECKLTLSESKTKLVHIKNPNNKGNGKHENESFDFLGFTYKPRLTKTKNGTLLLTTPAMSSKAKVKVLDAICKMKFHLWQVSLKELAETVNQRTRGWINYYGFKGRSTTSKLWFLLNRKLIKWVKWQRGWQFKRALNWLRAVHKAQPMLFAHWEITHP
jgi:RNA-directed DNA polymerase